MKAFAPSLGPIPPFVGPLQMPFLVYCCLLRHCCCRYIPHRHTERRLQTQTCFSAVYIAAQAERVQFLYVDCIKGK